MAKRKHPIAPLPDEEEKEMGQGTRHIVEMEGEEIELRQEEAPLPESGGMEAPM